MKNLLGRFAILVALLMGWAPAGHSQTAAAPLVRKIQIEHVGPPAASDDLIRAQLRLKPGEAYNPMSVDEDIRALYSTGYFLNIRVGAAPTAPDVKPDGVIVTYIVQGKPRLTAIQIVGNKRYSQSRLRKKIASKIGDPLDERKLFADTQEIVKYYQKSGYQKTQVKYSPSIDESAGRGTVTFEVTESPKVKIREVVFDGATAFKQSQLRHVLKTRHRWMFSWITGSGILKDDVFEEDKERLAAFYLNEGYIDFDLKEVKFETVNPKWMVIHFVVSEGRQYKVGSVTFKGNQLFTAEQILKGLGPWTASEPNRPGRLPAESKPRQTKKGLRLATGQIFTPEGLARDVEAIEDFYGSKGYIGKGEASHIYVDAIKIPNTDRGTMDIVYELEEGEKSFVEKIEIQGNHKTRDKVIRRELAISPGEAFDLVRLKRSKSRIEQMQYFEKVETKIEPTEVPNRKNLVIGVDEANTAQIYVGAGYGTEDGVLGYVELSQGNFDLFNVPHFTGGGQRFRIYVAIGTSRQDYIVSFVEPWFLGRKLQLSVDLFHRETSYWSDYYDLQRTGATVGLAQSLLGYENLVGKISYTLESIGVVNVDADAPPSVKLEEGSSLISKMGLQVTYDTSNHATTPDRGQRTSVSTELAGLGGEKNFYKWEVNSAWFFRGLGEGHILKLQGKAGVVDAYSDTPTVPFYERFFLGGAYSMRGYRYLHAGANDTFENGEPVGGDTMWFATAEYSIPIIDRVRIAAFYDIGSVTKDAYQFSTEFLHDYGIGLRLNLPIGPLRFDYGIPINSGDWTGDSGRFHFSVGYEKSL